jgi:hypothetical protein
MEPDLITNVIRRSVAPLHTVSTSELCIGHKLLFTFSSLSPRLNRLSLLLPTLDGWTLPCWFYGSWVWLGCWPHAESGFSTFWCADPTPPVSSSYLVVVVWTSLGPLLWWVPRPTTRWAPVSTLLVLHDTCWRGAQGLKRNSTRLGSYTCPDPCKVLLAVHD